MSQLLMRRVTCLFSIQNVRHVCYSWNCSTTVYSAPIHMVIELRPCYDLIIDRFVDIVLISERLYKPKAEYLEW